jgi:hypothetical protein
VCYGGKTLSLRPKTGGEGDGGRNGPSLRRGRDSPKKICFPRERCFPKEAFVLDNCIIKTYMTMSRLSVLMFLTLALGDELSNDEE